MNVLDSVLPGKPDAERAVLASIFIKNSVLSEVRSLVTVEDFIDERHKAIFNAQLASYEEHGKVDLVIVKDLLRGSGALESIGGVSYLADLLNECSAPSNAPLHCRVMITASLQRQLATMADKLSAEAFGGEIDAATDRMKRMAATIAERRSRGNTRKAADALAGIMNRLQAVADGDTSTFGITTGITQLDSIIGSMAPGDLVIVAARPAGGKTALGAQIAEANASAGPVFVASAEMTTEQLLIRLLATGRNSVNRLREGYVDDWQELVAAMTALSKLDLWIDDRPGTTPSIIQAIGDRLKQSYGLRLVVVDYLQILRDDVSSRNKQRYERVGDTARALKEIAKYLGVPVIALCQLGREVGKGKRPPVLEDLRESGDIEANADKVIAIWHPAVSGITIDDEGTSTEGMAKLLVLKNRQGPCGRINMTYDGPHTKFVPFVQRQPREREDERRYYED